MLSGVGQDWSNSNGDASTNEASIAVNYNSDDGETTDASDNRDEANTLPKTNTNSVNIESENTEPDNPEFHPLESKLPSPGMAQYVHAVMVPAAQTWMAAMQKHGDTPASGTRGWHAIEPWPYCSGNHQRY